MRLGKLGLMLDCSTASGPTNLFVDIIFITLIIKQTSRCESWMHPQWHPVRPVTGCTYLRGHVLVILVVVLLTPVLLLLLVCYIRMRSLECTVKGCRRWMRTARPTPCRM